MKEDTYIKLYRKSLKSAVFDAEPLWYLWTYLLLSANWAERQLADGTILKPGQMVRGHRRIAEDLGWGVSKVARWLKRLEAPQFGNITITHRNGTLAQVITICNWETYQETEGTSGTLPERKRNASGTLAERKEEEIEVKKGKNNYGYSPSFLEWWECYPRKTGKAAADKSHDAAVKRIRLFESIGADEARQRLMAAVKTFAASDKGQGDFCWHPKTWLDQGHYDDDPETWKDSKRERQPRPPVGQTGRVHDRSYDNLPVTRASDAEPPGGA